MGEMSGGRPVETQARRIVRILFVFFRSGAAAHNGRVLPALLLLLFLRPRFLDIVLNIAHLLGVEPRDRFRDEPDVRHGDDGRNTHRHVQRAPATQEIRHQRQ